MNAWELTRDQWEFELIRVGERRLYGQGRYGVSVAHREEVRLALNRGETIPAEVLGLYPDLEKAMKARVKLAEKPVEVQAAPVVQSTEPLAVAAVLESRDVEAGLAAWGKRWQDGESIRKLAAEAGIDWPALQAKLRLAGYFRAPKKGDK